MLKLTDIIKIYHTNESPSYLFKRFQLSLPAGEFLSIIGSNGSGKTSLLNIICGSIPIDGGSIQVAGKEISHSPEYKRLAYIGRVYQNPSAGTCPSMSIFENMSLADHKGKTFHLSAGKNRKRLDFYRQSLENLGLGLENKMDMPVGLLSGGQRQAIALLMATLTPIQILILDEHTAALDPKTADLIMQLTEKIVTEKKLTTLMVTHNLRYAIEYGSRMIMMHQGEIALDRSQREKSSMQSDEILQKFHEVGMQDIANQL
ncbi:ABC transporter ATP-binding protein [Clostridia bacterium]|nr:ABC transporter ATP-binding protein [Clostridia bacterium]